MTDARTICKALGGRWHGRYGYLRRLLVHGSRAVLRWTRFRPERRSPWLEGMLARRPTNVVLVAMANKTARVVWAMLSRSETYNHPRRSAIRGETGTQEKR